jgi:hypothetical protein
VAEDMAAQARWARLARPRLGAVLKFRPPYVEGAGARTFEYLGGRVQWQVWAPRGSTEGRLLVPAAALAPGAPLAARDAAHYQDSCAVRNVVARPWATCAPPAPGLEGVEGYDRCLDCSREAEAWAEYAALPRALPGAPPALMRRLTRAIRQPLVEAHPPPYHGRAARLPAPRRLEALLALAGPGWESAARRQKGPRRARA